MHDAQRNFTKRFIADWVVPNFSHLDKINVLDVGSRDVNGAVRHLFEDIGANYIGLDMVSGPNVDVIPKDTYDWKELQDGYFHAIVSGSCFEHIEYPWLTMEQVALKLHPEGYACIIAPSRGPKHEEPWDCYRYFERGMSSLAKWAGLNVKYCKMKRSYWNDICMIASHLE